jgi:hypothetical protein
MNGQELNRIVGRVRILCPGQAFENGYFDGWMDVLGTYTYADALEALKALAGRPFISPIDIAQHIRLVRDQRIVDTQLPDSKVDPDDIPAWLAEHRRNLRLAADGKLPTRPEYSPLPELNAPRPRHSEPRSAGSLVDGTFAALRRASDRGDQNA